MKVTDNIGNELVKDDLVLFSDDKGNVLLCVVSAINEPSVIAAKSNNPMEMQGNIQLIPMPITLPWVMAMPRITQITKATKPPQWNKPRN